MRRLIKILSVSTMIWSLLIWHTFLYAGVTEDKKSISTDSKGVTTSSTNYKFDGISDEDMIKSLAMLSAGVITGRMLKVYTPATPDVMIAGAAGAAFIAGEIMSNVKFKGEIDAISLEIDKKSDATINEEQIQRLINLKTSYEKAKSATNTKKKLQKASAVAFGVAAATAMYLQLSEQSMSQACSAALVSAQKSMVACSGAVGSVGASCKFCQGQLATYSTQFTNYYARRFPPSPSNQKGKSLIAPAAYLQLDTNYCGGLVTSGGPTVLSVVAGLRATCGAAVGMLIYDEVDANPILLKQFTNIDSKIFLEMVSGKNIYSYTEFENFQSHQTSYLEKGLNIFFPMAQASWLPLLGLSATTAAAFTASTFAGATYIDTMMFVPQNRAIAFAALGAVAMMAANSSDNMLNEIENHLNKIQNILDNLQKLKSGSKTKTIQQDLIIAARPNSANSVVDNSPVQLNQTTPCMSGNDSTNCKVLSSQLEKMPSFGNLPESFKNIAAQSVKLGEDLSGTKTISGSVISSASDLASKANAINGILKNQKEKLFKNSNKASDFEKNKDLFLKGLSASIKKGLRQEGTTASALMANIGMAPINSKNAEKSDEVVKSNMTNPVVGSMSPASDVTKKSDEEDKKEEMSLDFSEQAPEARSVAEASSMNKEYDVVTNEISKENGPSLFDLISSRYLKSGYPKLLEEDVAEKK